jgi:hypothetical protein
VTIEPVSSSGLTAADLRRMVREQDEMVAEMRENATKVQMSFYEWKRQQPVEAQESNAMMQLEAYVAGQAPMHPLTYRNLKERLEALGVTGL